MCATIEQLELSLTFFATNGVIVTVESSWLVGAMWLGMTVSPENQFLADNISSWRGRIAWCLKRLLSNIEWYLPLVVFGVASLPFLYELSHLRWPYDKLQAMVERVEGSIEWIGDQPTSQVVRVDVHDRLVHDADLKCFCACQRIESLDLSGTSITNAALTHVSRLRSLVTLNLSRTPVTDHGIERLANAENLQRLSLAGTRISDESLVTCVTLVNLRELDLSDTQVSDRGILVLSRCRTLKVVKLSDRWISPSTIAALHEALPRLQIVTGLHLETDKQTGL